MLHHYWWIMGYKFCEDVSFQDILAIDTCAIKLLLIKLVEALGCNKCKDRYLNIAILIYSCLVIVRLAVLQVVLANLNKLADDLELMPFRYMSLTNLQFVSAHFQEKANAILELTGTGLTDDQVCCPQRHSSLLPFHTCNCHVFCRIYSFIIRLQFRRICQFATFLFFYLERIRFLAF